MPDENDENERPQFPEGTVEISGDVIDIADPETWDEVEVHGDPNDR